MQEFLLIKEAEKQRFGVNLARPSFRGSAFFKDSALHHLFKV